MAFGVPVKVNTASPPEHTGVTPVSEVKVLPPITSIVTFIDDVQLVFVSLTTKIWGPPAKPVKSGFDWKAPLSILYW